MARRRKQAAPPMDTEPPAWFWEFDGRQWGWHSKNVRSCQGRVDGHYAARRRWHDACSAWLTERGLVMWEHNGGAWRAYQRIEREEPHRILRRPEKSPPTP